MLETDAAHTMLREPGAMPAAGPAKRARKKRARPDDCATIRRLVVEIPAQAAAENILDDDRESTRRYHMQGRLEDACKRLNRKRRHTLPELQAMLLAFVSWIDPGDIEPWKMDALAAVVRGICGQECEDAIGANW